MTTRQPSRFTPNTPIGELPHLVDVYDCAAWLDCSPAVVRGLIGLKRLSAVKVGRRQRVVRRSLAAFAHGAVAPDRQSVRAVVTRPPAYGRRG